MSTDPRKLAQAKAFAMRVKMIGKSYRHFKGNYYTVKDIAVHSETAELMVVYYSQSDPTNMWVRPLDMFLSPVDKEKYPDVKQKMRFELVKH